MSIRVTCNKCHTRFNVSEKFAGKEGPCPKCKTKIRVPMPTEAVQIEAPKSKGPTDTEGRAIVNPLLRKDTVLSAVQIAMLVAGSIAFLALSFGMRFVVSDWATALGWIVLGCGALVIALPLLFVAYHIIRDNELQPFKGFELWKRVGICSVVFAATWLALPAAAYAFNGQYMSGSWILASVIMFAAGAVASMGSFEFDWLFGVVLFGLYFAVAVVARLLGGLPALPQTPPRTTPGGTGVDPWATSMLESVGTIVDFVCTCV